MARLVSVRNQFMKGNHRSNHMVSIPLKASGSIVMKKDGSDFLKIDINDSNVTVSIIDDKLLKDNLKQLPAAVKKLKVLHKISNILNVLGITLELKYKNESIIKMGKGIKSLIGNVKVHILRVKEFI